MNGGDGARAGGKWDWTFIDDVVCPDYRAWGVPRAPVAAWIATHITAATLFLATVGAATLPDRPWRFAVATVWVVTNSGLVLRLGRFLLARTWSGHVGDVASPHRWQHQPNAKAGVFMVLTTALLTVMQPVGGAAITSFVATAAIVLGVRIAGLEAWEGKRREPLHYIRAVMSRRGIGQIVLAVAVSALLFWAMARFLDPNIRGLDDIERWLSDRDFSRRRQWTGLVFNAAIVTVPALVVCEAISTVARYENELNAQLAEHERVLERRRFAGLLHGDAHSITSQIVQTATDPQIRELAMLLSTRLRQLQFEQQGDEPKLIRDCLGYCFELATLRRIQIVPEIDAVILDAEMRADSASLLIHVLLDHIKNTADHGGRLAWVRIEAAPDEIHLTYFDDGEQFDPRIALDGHGGLAQLSSRLDLAGGALSHTSEDGRTVARARIPH